MRIQTLNGSASLQKPDRVWITFLSGESSNSLTNEPIALTSNDGFTCKSLNSAGAALADSALVGVVDGVVAAGKIGIAQVYGISGMDVGILMRTKTDAAASDTALPTVSAAAGLILKPDTVNNCFTTAASVAASAFLPFGCIIESMSSATAAAASTLTKSKVYSKVFLRLL